jgi:hypothetical protein
VRTASGATAVQIAEYDGGRRKIVAHVGSAHTEAELGILLERAREMLAVALLCSPHQQDKIFLTSQTKCLISKDNF